MKPELRRWYLILGRSKAVGAVEEIISLLNRYRYSLALHFDDADWIKIHFFYFQPQLEIAVENLRYYIRAYSHECSEADLELLHDKVFAVIELSRFNIQIEELYENPAELTTCDVCETWIKDIHKSLRSTVTPKE